jgi:hypothetical protein
MSTDATSSELNLDWLISVDDHILEPPDLWVDRVAAKDRDRAPRMEFDENGLDYWTYDGKKFPSSGLSAVAGKDKEEFSPEPLPYSEMRPGCYDSKARVEDMDRAGILASLCFPTITRSAPHWTPWWSHRCRRFAGATAVAACRGRSKRGCHGVLPPTTTVWTSSTPRGNAVERVTDGNEPDAPVDAVHEIVHVTDTEPAHAAGRPDTPVRSR